ncbi:hypothetical protein HMPREF9120_02420 [Neisseria sp. oral taxon 020 str. F0370]|nr:hypothetical protein HMPREF9120_02420 [Neisseria sp. oral taxon 020 str. F0370]
MTKDCWQQRGRLKTQNRVFRRPFAAPPRLAQGRLKHGESAKMRRVVPLAANRQQERITK